MTDRRNRLTWGHININVGNLERSVAFYERLGFAVFMPGVPYLGLSAEPPATPIPQAGARAFGLPEKIRGRACIMQLDDGFPKLDLTEFEAEAPRPPSGNADLGLVRLCLASPDLQADYTRLTAEGVPFLSPPQTGTDGLADVATCVDPDGTCIELIQIYPDKWASLSMR